MPAIQNTILANFIGAPNQADWPQEYTGGRYFLAPEPAKAVATPSEINIPPETYRGAWVQRELPRSQRARVPAKRPQRLSVVAPISAKSVPRKKIWPGTLPREASTNCGRNAKKKRAVFGFRIFTTM